MKLRIAAILLAALPTLASAQAFKAVNRLTVVPLGGGAFEVIEARGEGARGMWCAAADYALARSQANGQRLYVKTPRGPAQSVNGRKGVVFTTNEASLGVPTQQSLSVSVRTAGVGLPLHHAYQFCRDYQLDLDDVLYRRHGNG